ncbi:MAG: hypothetical protein ACRDH8_12950 [Actinomycetota bacterium]
MKKARGMTMLWGRVVLTTVQQPRTAPILDAAMTTLTEGRYDGRQRHGVAVRVPGTTLAVCVAWSRTPLKPARIWKLAHPFRRRMTGTTAAAGEFAEHNREIH